MAYLTDMNAKKKLTQLGEELFYSSVFGEKNFNFVNVSKLLSLASPNGVHSIWAISHTPGFSAQHLIQSTLDLYLTAANSSEF